MNSPALIVSYGGGVNSTAMLIGLRDRGIIPDLITFADTGAEFPATYEFIAKFDQIIQSWGFSAIITVYKTFRGEHEGLERECLRKGMLPGLAYGTKSCSQKHKVQPQDQYLKRWIKKHKVPLPVVKFLGFDAGEPWRAKKTSPQPALFTNRYPLVEWGWNRAKCLEVCQTEGLVPAKSSCFMCPAMKKWEVIRLAREQPDLAERGLAIEKAAEVNTQRGLGAQWRWTELLANDEAQQKLLLNGEGTEERNPFLPCGCVDG
jgi:hypothetical protein